MLIVASAFPQLRSSRASRVAFPKPTDILNTYVRYLLCQPAWPNLIKKEQFYELSFLPYFLKEVNPLEATVGVAPTHSGFADRRVNYFTMWPKWLVLYTISFFFSRAWDLISHNPMDSHERR